jgi:hypothetical protein
MTKQDQKEFIISMCDSAKKYFLERIDKVPGNWDGIELREWFADIARGQFAYKKMGKERKMNYNNDVIVNNL